MATGYPSKAVGNWFLDRFRNRRLACTQLQLNKIVFIAHGWHLAYDIRRDGLIDEPVVAWKYGPVIPALRDEFRDCGSKPIEYKATEWMGGDELYEPNIMDSDPKQWELRLLDWIWDRYGHLNGPELIARTHRPGTPWAIVTHNGTDIGHNKVIPLNLIREYYSKMREQADSIRSLEALRFDPGG